MSNKIIYCTERGGEYVEFPLTVTRIILPNGDEYTFRYCPVRNGLVLNKAFSDNASDMTITPCVSNEILIQ